MDLPEDLSTIEDARGRDDRLDASPPYFSDPPEPCSYLLCSRSAAPGVTARNFLKFNDSERLGGPVWAVPIASDFVRCSKLRAARGGTDIKKVARQKTKGKGKA